MNTSPYKLYTPTVREPLPLRRKPYILPAPPEMPDKPQKIDWLRTLLPPFIMLVVLGIVSAVIQARSFFVYTMIMMGVYPIARVVAYLVQKRLYEKKEEERRAIYNRELEHAEREIVTYIRKQRDLLKSEYLSTEGIIKLAKAGTSKRTLWYRTNAALDFLSLRAGTYDGSPSFQIEVPKGDEIDHKDLLLSKAKEIKQKYQTVEQLPYLIRLKELGSLAITGEEKSRYGLAQRLLLEVLVHHRPDELEVYILSSHKKANLLWGWLRWAPHCKVFGDEKEFDHLIFGSQAVKMFLGRLENFIGQDRFKTHAVFIVDVDGIQQYDDDFVQRLISQAQEWNLSLIFVGGNQMPRSVRGVLKIRDGSTGIFVDAKIDTKDKGDKEYHTIIALDDLPDLKDCESVTRTLASIKLLSSSGDELLSPNVSLFDVLGFNNDNKLTFQNVATNWAADELCEVRIFQDKELLQFPIGLVEENSQLVPYSLNLLEARLGGKDAYHTMLIGTTGSGKSEFIKSLILAAAHTYPPSYLNFFCMDFKGGSTVDQLEALPHVNGVLTNLDEVLAQRGLIAIKYEIERRQAEFKISASKDIWQYNEGKHPSERMPHLLLILDEFTRGLELLNTPDYSLQDVLEKQLVPQGRSLGIFLLLANQVANSKALKLLPNIGWRIALRVASKEQMQFIAAGLKPPKFSGRGYIQAIGEDPKEFQAGYSGDYVKYSNLLIKPKDIVIKELFPDGSIRNLKDTREARDSKDGSSGYESFLEMNQLKQAIGTVQKQMEIEPARKMYQKPLPHIIELEKTNFDNTRYREFTSAGWSTGTVQANLLQVPVGYVDFVNKCSQEPLVLDFLQKNPNLLIVGSQTDINDGLRSILFSLNLAHSPNDLQIYMLEFGKGLRDLPLYPHIGDIVAEGESERIARTVEYFESEFSRREEKSRSNEIEGSGSSPRLFLVINNIAGIKDNGDLYQRIFRFILQESYKFGIHIVVTALPRGTGTRVPSGDLKTIKSRIVFPSINHEDYWHYLDVAERKLVKLTNIDQPFEEKERNSVSRAHWLCVNDPAFDTPVEIQLARPSYRCQEAHVLASQMNIVDGFTRPERIKILEEKYPFRARSCSGSPENSLPLGIRWSNLEELFVAYSELPSIWGVSGPRTSGKTNFLALFIDQWRSIENNGDIEIFSVFPNILSTYFDKNGYRIVNGNENICLRLKKLASDGCKDDDKKRLLIFDDLNLYWERDSDINKEIRAALEVLSGIVYGKTNTMILASFNYSVAVKSAKARDGLIRELHDNKTGLCLGYEGDWIVNPGDLASYKKKSGNVAPPGRGVFVLRGKETEVQTFFYEGE